MIALFDRVESRGPVEVAIFNAGAIAELFWQIHAQPRTAWTFEADARPWAEKF